MKLILAKSNDGFFATGPTDNMKWTGPVDKFVFKLLTLFSPDNIFVGNVTYKLLPSLVGRSVTALSRDGLTLEQAYDSCPKGWIIGGPTIAKLALELNLIDKAIICTPNNVNIEQGISASDIMLYLEDNNIWAKQIVTLNKELTVSIYHRIKFN